MRFAVKVPTDFKFVNRLLCFVFGLQPIATSTGVQTDFKFKKRQPCVLYKVLTNDATAGLNGVEAVTGCCLKINPTDFGFKN